MSDTLNVSHKMPDEQKLSRSETPKLDTNVQAHLGSELRELYRAMLREPVPERFLELLDQLEGRKGKR